MGTRNMDQNLISIPHVDPGFRSRQTCCEPNLAEDEELSWSPAGSGALSSASP